VDVPENLGTGAQHYEMEFLPIEDSTSAESSTATVQGVPLDTESGAPADSGLASFGDAMASGDAPRETAAPGRRTKEN
jgi:hypothetical protein